MRNKCIGIVFLAYIYLFLFGFFVQKERTFSETENRVLASKPKLTWKSVSDGSYTVSADTYLGDHIPCKDTFVKIATLNRRALGQTYMNGVYFGADGRMLRDYKYEPGQLEKNVGYVNEFADTHPEYTCAWLLVPNACYVYEEAMPKYAACYDQGAVADYLGEIISDNITVADCRDALLAEKRTGNDMLYYKTDHHWTADGAYAGYTVLCDALGIKPCEKEAYDIFTDENAFYGSIYSDAPDFTKSGDRIRLYQNKTGTYHVSYVDTGEEADSLYARGNLDKKDKYTVYLDGNHSYTVIKSNAENKEKLLVVKDSYAHCLVPLLADNYSEIHMIDLRYYHDSVSDLAKREGIQTIVFVNNIEFLTTDNNFLWLR